MLVSLYVQEAAARSATHAAKVVATNEPGQMLFSCSLGLSQGFGTESIKTFDSQAQRCIATKRSRKRRKQAVIHRISHVLVNAPATVRYGFDTAIAAAADSSSPGNGGLH